MNTCTKTLLLLAFDIKRSFHFLIRVNSNLKGCRSKALSVTVKWGLIYGLRKFTLKCGLIIFASTNVMSNTLITRAGDVKRGKKYATPSSATDVLTAF